MQLFDFAVLLLTFVGLATSFLAVWRIRKLKSELIEERQPRINDALIAIGDIESLREAKSRALVIGDIMRLYGLAGLILPLKSGGRVNLRLESTGIRICSA